MLTMAMIFAEQQGFYTINSNFPSDSSSGHEAIRGVELYDADGVGAGSGGARGNNSGEIEFPVAPSSFFFYVLFCLFFLYVWVFYFWALRIELRWEVFHFPFISDDSGGISCLSDQWKTPIQPYLARIMENNSTLFLFQFFKIYIHSSFIQQPSILHLIIIMPFSQSPKIHAWSRDCGCNFMLPRWAFWVFCNKPYK